MHVRHAFDHLLLGISDLDHGIDWVEQRTGVRALMGGVHPGQGTRNALLSLGGAHYLEIIALDPAQTAGNRRAQISKLAEPRLINFAVKTDDMSQTAASVQSAGLHAIGPRDGSRQTPAGGLLRWKALNIETKLQSDGIDPVPFFIEWARDSTHPSTNAPRGCTLDDLRFEHPDVDGLTAAFKAMGLDAAVAHANQARIMAILKTPKGRVELS